MLSKAMPGGDLAFSNKPREYLDFCTFLFIPRRTKNSYRLAQIKMHDINVALSGPVSFVLFLAKHASLLFSSAFPSAECEGLLSLLVIRLTKGNSG